MNKNTLHLFLKHVWFEKIKSGIKMSEYRACSDYWNKKFEPVVCGTQKMWEYVIFHDGYTSNTVKRKLISIKITNAANDLNLPHVWELKLAFV